MTRNANRGRVTINGESPTEATIEIAVRALGDGGVVAFPTDTLYGLTVDAHNRTARARLGHIKHRPATHPPPFLLGTLEMLSHIARMPLPPVAQTAVEHLWPGPLTLVVPASEGWDWTAPDGTVGVRLPASPLARKLCTAMSSPLPATSANRSGSSVAPLSADDVARELDVRDIAVLIDGGVLPPSRGSTVVACPSEGAWRVLRDGDVSRDTLETVLGRADG